VKPLPQKEFAAQEKDVQLKDDLVHLVRLAIREDLDRGFDLTTVAVVPAELPAQAHIVARVHGVAAGLDLVDWILETINCTVQSQNRFQDGERFEAGQTLAVLVGDARDILTCERTVLNFLGRLCGIATWTRRHVDCLRDLSTRIYDTRKTTPGWRRLEKYAVRCGGGYNHRHGLYDAILIKDNHLACHQQLTGNLLNPAEAVERAKQFIRTQPSVSPDTVIEIEVDTLEQLSLALSAQPDIVLLDNMTLDQLRVAVRMRDESGLAVILEASGGVRLESLREIALTGVDRISMGALTHSAVNLDLGLDWFFG
jgi:nicotinate-nucleotide pyrophosphorylase (carboxylating)